MTISLSPEQRAWLKAHVERGDFRSIEEAALQLIDERIAERMIEDGDDMAWAKAIVDEGLADIAAGRTMTRDQHERRMDGLMASIKD